MSTKVTLYHISHWQHLSSIVQNGCLYCCAAMQEKQIDYTNIANRQIQTKRSSRKVPIPPYGVLHDYVPFYFAPRSPMLGSIHQGMVEGYTEGQRPIIHLVSSLDAVLNQSLRFIFTDGHAGMRRTHYYSALSDLDKLDWEVIRSWKWNNTEDDTDRTRRKQAEFLVYHSFPWSLISEIGVQDGRMANQVHSILITHMKPPYPRITTQSKWYYQGLTND